MKNQLKKLSKLVFVYLIIVVSSCQKDELQTDSSNHNFNLKTENGTFAKFQLKALTNSLKIYNEEKSIKSNLTMMSDGFYFTIDTTKILKMTDDLTVSYTIRVKNAQTPKNSFQNLVISQYRNLPPQAYLFTYFPDEDYINRLKKDPKTYFSGTSRIGLLDINTIKYQVENCTTSYRSACDWGGSTHPAGDNCENTYMTYLTTCTDSPSYGDGGGGGGYYGGGGSGDDYGGGSAGGSIYGNFTRPVPYSERFYTSEIGSGIDEFYFIEDNITLSGAQMAWLTASVDRIHTIYNYLSVNNTFAGKAFAKEIVEQMRLNPDLNFDIEASSKSPANIDRSAITDATPEGKNFNELYDALSESSEFKKLFVDIFQDSKRFNVKFEIADHVYEDNDPAKKEVNATTSQDPVTKNLTIKISKQILIAGIPKSQTKIENAKTILHECIHAYLFVKANYPTAGTDFVKILNTMYPTPNEQHDFMYNKMIPTMQKVLSEIRDLVTTDPRRTDVSDLKIYTRVDKSAFEIWNWANYYKFLSVKGLEESNCYKEDYPDPSDALFLWGQYINYGHARLDKN